MPQTKKIPHPPIFLPNNIPFDEGRESIVNVKQIPVALTTFTLTTSLAWASTYQTATTSKDQNKPLSLQLMPVCKKSTKRGLFPITKWQ
jgi:hypothetical protein